MPKLFDGAVLYSSLIMLGLSSKYSFTESGPTVYAAISYGLNQNVIP